MPRYVSQNPWTDAANVGEGIGNKLSQELIQLPLMRWQLLAEQRRLDAEQAYRQRQEQLDRDRLAEEKRYHDLVEGGRDTRSKLSAESRAKLEKQREDFETTLTAAKGKTATDLEKSREEAAMARTKEQDTARAERDKNNASKASYGVDAKGNPIIRSPTGFSELPDITPKQPTVDTHWLPNLGRRIIGEAPLPPTTNNPPQGFSAQGMPPMVPVPALSAPGSAQPPVQAQPQPAAPVAPPPQPPVNAATTAPPAAAPVAPAQVVRVRHPNGQTGTLPADYVKTNGLPAGFTIIQ